MGVNRIVLRFIRKDHTELAGVKEKIIKYARGLHAGHILQRAVACHGRHRNLAFQRGGEQGGTGVGWQMQDGIARELRKARLFRGTEATGKGSERNTCSAGYSGRGKLQIRVEIVIQKIRETRLQELSLDCDGGAIDPERLQLEENGIEQLRGGRLR